MIMYIFTHALRVDCAHKNAIKCIPECSLAALLAVCTNYNGFKSCDGT